MSTTPTHSSHRFCSPLIGPQITSSFSHADEIRVENSVDENPESGFSTIRNANAALEFSSDTRQAFENLGKHGQNHNKSWPDQPRLLKLLGGHCRKALCALLMP